MGSRRGGGANLGQVVVERDDHLVIEMAALLGKALVLEMQAGDPALLKFAHRARHVELVTIAGIGIGDHRDFHGGGQTARILRHLGHSDEAVIGIAQRGRSARAGHVDDGKAGLLDDPCADAVIGTRRHDHAIPLQERAELCCRRITVRSHRSSSGAP